MTSRGITIALVASIAVNVLFVGALIGAGIVYQRAEVQERPLTGIGQPARLRAAAQQLTPAHRRELLQAIRITVRDMRNDARQSRESRLEAARLLRDERYDRAALDAALARARQSDVAIRTQLEAVVLDFAATLPQDEREALVQGLVRAAAARRQNAAALAAPADTSPAPAAAAPE